MLRRPVRPPPAGFSIALPVKQSIAVENKKEADVEGQLVINGDDSIVSPLVTTEFQEVAAKFFHVEKTNIYVLTEGVSVFGGESDLPELVESPSGKGSSFDSAMLDDKRPSMTLSASRSDLEGGELEDVLLEVQQREQAAAAAAAAPAQAARHHHSSGRRRCPALDMNTINRVGFVGRGQQGVVHSVRTADGVLRALKTIDVHEATKATSDVERQGRKMGIVRELNMVKALRNRHTTHLVEMYDAVYANEELYILMELLSSSVDLIQRQLSRLPHSEVLRSCQTVFHKHLSGTSNYAHAPQKRESKVYPNACRAHAQVPRQTPVPDIILAMLAQDLLYGLHELHTVHHKVHCDLKPENIMMTMCKQHFKIADFGCTINLGPDGMVTQRGVGLGSKMYKSPEQLGVDPFDDHEKVRFDAKADIWALGIVLLELANGCHPTELFKTDFWNFATKLRYETLIKPIAASVPFQDFIGLCLAHNPQQRPTAATLLEHPFVQKFSRVPRQMLKTWVLKMETDSNRFQNTIKREMLRKSVLLATHTVDKEKHTRASSQKWKTFTNFLAQMPTHSDPSLFPSL